MEVFLDYNNNSTIKSDLLNFVKICIRSVFAFYTPKKIRNVFSR